MLLRLMQAGYRFEDLMADVARVATGQQQSTVGLTTRRPAGASS
jgi:hypothetical protein